MRTTLTLHEMAKDEARHGAGFKGLLKRYFGQALVPFYPPFTNSDNP